MICHFRDHRECLCALGTCQQQRKPVPTVSAHRGDFLRIFGFFAVVTIVAFWALSEADRQFARQDLERQEQTHVSAK